MTKKDDHLENVKTIIIYCDSQRYMCDVVTCDENGIKVIINDYDFYPHKKIYTAELYSDSKVADFKYKANVTVKCLNNNLGLHALTIVAKEKIENREYVRVYVNCDGILHTTANVAKEIQVVNISEGGLGFIALGDSAKNPLVGTVTVSFTYLGQEVKANCLILSAHNAVGFNKCMYHCKYDGMNKIELNAIRKLINLIQLEKIKQRNLSR